MGRVPNSTAGRKLYEKERGIVKVMNHSIQNEVITIFFGTRKKLFHKKNEFVYSTFRAKRALYGGSTVRNTLN